MVEEVRRLNRLLDKENARLREELREIRRDERYVAEARRMKAVLEQVPASPARRARSWCAARPARARRARPDDPRLQPALLRAVRGREHGGHPREPHRERAVRAREGRVHRGPGAARRPLRAGARRQLFLDEIGDAPLPVQVRLLRVLQEREVQRVGAGESFKVDVRVVAATNRPLETMVREGRFREDLFYRLNVFPLVVPPLRERREDVRPLATYFLGRQAARMHRHPPRVSEAAWRALEASSWPGHVRELENYLERALILSSGEELALPQGLASAPEPSSAAASASCRRAFRGWSARLPTCAKRQQPIPAK
jgi:formate hydrogenlyase transcriptional activator